MGCLGKKDDKTIYRFTEKVRNTLAYMPYAELLFISAKTGQRLPKLFETIDMVLQYQNLRVQTGVLNEILTEAMAMQQPPSDRGKRLKIYYMTQVSVKPPTFVIFVNDKELMHFSYVRYLENKIRESVRLPRHTAEIHHQRTKREGAVKSYGTDHMPFDRIRIWPFSDLIYLWKDEGN